MNAPPDAPPVPYRITVWARGDGSACGWHVSMMVGLEPRRPVDAELERLGMAWDEMLGAVARLLVAPGGAPNFAQEFLIAPIPGWRIVALLTPAPWGVQWGHDLSIELDPEPGRRLYRSLTVGEALAVLVASTLPDSIRRGGVPFTFELVDAGAGPGASCACPSCDENPAAGHGDGKPDRHLLCRECEVAGCTAESSRCEEECLCPACDEPVSAGHAGSDLHGFCLACELAGCETGAPRCQEEAPTEGVAP